MRQLVHVQADVEIDQINVGGRRFVKRQVVGNWRTETTEAKLQFFVDTTVPGMERCPSKRPFSLVDYVCPSFNGAVLFKNVNNCLYTNIYSYLETSGGQSYNPYQYVVHFWLIRHLWKLKTIVFLHWCLIFGLLLGDERGSRGNN